ncbi:rRNA-processing protein EFG1 [Blastomyces dermatitidis ATCC 26199]|nr:rRNA-processing protein EFG1 [Blastomyces dermatitidis ATCC 26199]
MASFTKQGKRKDIEDDSISFETSKRHRGNNLDAREASPRARDEQDDRRKYRDRSECDSKTRKQPSNPRIHDPNPYTKAQSQRDDRAYTAGRAAVKPFRSRDVDLPSAGELKNKIRDIKRLLKRADHLPADVKIEKERALVGYERDLEIVESRKNRAAMIKRYHFVRFLERKAATRRLNKLLRRKKTLTESDPTPNKEELDSLEEQIYLTQVDLNYAIYSPLTEKYISLYPNQRRDKQAPELEPEPEDSDIIRNCSGEKPPLWHAVEQSMKDGTLELLRDGKLGIGISGQKKTTANSGPLAVLSGRKDGDESVDGLSLAVEAGGKKHGKKKREKENENEKRGDVKKGKLGSSGSRMEDVDMNGRKNNNDDVNHDDDDDDSDGGFFEE